MTLFHRDRRKIDPTRGDLLPDGSPNDNDRVEIGPTPLAFAEWAQAGLEPPSLPAMREFRWRRLVEEMVRRDVGGLLLFDPLNIRYATDSTNMQLWNSHNPFRAVFLGADGHMVLFDYKQAPFLSAFNPRVAEVRSGASFFYNVCGEGTEADARSFAGQVGELMREHGGGSQRVAVDKIMVHGLRALERAGFEVAEGEVVTERARAVKGPDEVRAMRCASWACERAVEAMERFAREEVPKGGVTEDDVWAVLHAENIRRGGEWIETRLLASGPRTNPWFQECGPRVVSEGEVLAFDTDLIGCYGICVDISRSWWLGERAPQRMRDAYAHGLDHVASHKERLRPGVTIREMTFGGHELAPEFRRQKYSCKLHGVGLCDEWPFVPYPDGWVEGAWEAAFEPGMTMCAEALVSPEGGDFSVKLEDQVLVTEAGCETLTRYPWDERFS